MDEIQILAEPRPTRADAVKNRELLILAARDLIAEKGVEAVTTAMVAARAGVGKGTLYRHFPNGMSEVCQALLDECQRHLQDRALRRFRAGGDPVDHLVWFMEEALRFVDERRPMLVTMEGVPGLAHPAHWWWMQTIRGLLGQINPQLDLDYAADALYVMLDPRTVQFQRETRGYSLERMITALIEVVYKLVD
ncbi:MAG: TetR/AcrR family transcriptional regulator [Anaerolineae bacterium]|nr:TetR/AcrR family transcriptional regulator [Anaerolineae bacterium]